MKLRYCLIVLSCIFAIIFQIKVDAQISYRDAFPNLPAFFGSTEIVSSNDGTNRLFVTEKDGKIWVFENDQKVSNRKLFLDVSDLVYFGGGETGLLGLAFHPDYSQNGYFYICFTPMIDSVLHSIVSRFSVSQINPDSAIKSSRLDILSNEHPHTWHVGGKLSFNENDGYLYISFGDGGVHENGQSTSTLNGKILRINVNDKDPGLEYSIPSTNYFFDSTGSQRKEIYAWGLRNTWKFCFDDVTGLMWGGDVGEDQYEEINIIKNGGNYGWSIMEGFFCNVHVNPNCDTSGLLKPIFVYGHKSGNDASIIGGYVYRGSNISALHGKYIYGDFLRGKIWALTYDGSNVVSNELILDTPHLITTFGEDINKNVYFSTRFTARIYEIFDATNIEPISNEIPDRFDLYQNFPNPFNPSTTIRFSLPQNSNVKLTVYNINGRIVETLIDNSSLRAGVYEIPFHAINLTSSVYFYTLVTEKYIESKKMLLIK